jgi:hypothetical protein
MLITRLAKGIAKQTSTGWRNSNLLQRLYLALLGSFCILMVILVVVGVVQDAIESHRFNQLSAATHLERAREACGQKFNLDAKSADESAARICTNQHEAERELSAIPASSTTYGDAERLRLLINQQQTRADNAWRAKYPLQPAPSSSSLTPQPAASQQALDNFSNLRQDAFQCATSTDGNVIVSFDNGKNWWRDDGRCQTRQQHERDSDADAQSYLPTTLRVNTDMNSYWLADEERTCESSPDDKGRVGTVICSGTKEGADHNIPVRFWGGVDRKTESSWKCRREKSLFSAEFVCRALN